MKTKEEKKEYQKQYYLKNVEKYRIKHLEWSLNNKEKQKLSRAKYYNLNREKILESQKIWYQNNKHTDKFKKYVLDNREKSKDGNRDFVLMRTYGINTEQYNDLLLKQNNLCAICNKSEKAVRNNNVVKLAIDHDHKTGKVRGLLCNKCNRGMGYFNDDVVLLNNVINYLLLTRT